MITIFAFMHRLQSWQIDALRELWLCIMGAWVLCFLPYILLKLHSRIYDAILRRLPEDGDLDKLSTDARRCIRAAIAGTKAVGLLSAASILGSLYLLWRAATL